MVDTKPPAWQQAAQSESKSQQQNTESTSTPTLDQAWKFLQDETVQKSNTEDKTEFLKSKGFSDEDIQKLLSEEPQQQPEPASEAKVEEGATPEPREEAVKESTLESTSASPQTPPSPSSSTSDTPPIITYPEFLTHSPRLPSLLTPTRLLNILTVSGTAWTLLYGAACFVVSPMVDTLNESRADYYGHVNTKMTEFVEKLEGVVSEVPYKTGKPLRSSDYGGDDDNSSYEDPTELFHRDIGTQTSPVSPGSSTGSVEAPIDKQARRLAQLTSSMKELSDMYTKKGENTANLHSSLREIRDDIDKLSYPPMTDYSSLYSGPGFGMGRSDEPQDEFKKVKDAIRSVKGLFLSSRMFPAAAR